MTLDDLAQHLADYIDEPDVTAAPAGRKRRIITDINGAIEEAVADGPSHFSKRPVGRVVHGPTAITLNVTNGSTTIASVTTWAAWMIGCTIRIAGTDLENELVTQTSLLQPYDGATGTAVGAVVYGDAIPMATDEIALLGLPELPNVRALNLVDTREQFLNADLAFTRDYGAELATIAASRRSIGQPHTCWVDSRLQADSTATAQSKWIRLIPLPAVATTIRYDAKLRIPSFTISDLGKSKPIQMPAEFVTSVILPIATQRFSGSPFFKNDDARDEIGRQYSKALSILRSLNPQNRRTTPMVPGYL